MAKKDPEESGKSFDRKKNRNTHSTRDAGSGIGSPRDKGRKAIALQRKADAAKPQYNPNGPN